MQQPTLTVILRMSDFGDHTCRWRKSLCEYQRPRIRDSSDYNRDSHQSGLITNDEMPGASLGNSGTYRKRCEDGLVQIVQVKW